MKKYILLGILLVMCSTKSFTSEKDSITVDTTMLRNYNDSISYAVGRANAVTGFKEYLSIHFKLDTLYNNFFNKGFKDGYLKGEDKKWNAYISGILAAKMVEEQIISEVQSDLGDKINLNKYMFYKGLTDLLENTDSVMSDSLAELLYYQLKDYQNKQNAQKYKSLGEQFLEENATKEHVQITPTGLQYIVTKKGKGKTPVETDRVLVKYEGKTVDGKIFDRSEQYSPMGVLLVVNQTIKGWIEGLKMMKKGAVYDFFIPYNLAYGESGAGKDIPPYSALIYHIELIDIVK